MAKMAAEPITVRAAASSSLCLLHRHRVSRIRASQPINGKNNFYKQLGMFSLRKKIEDSILSAEILAPTALEVEEARRIKQEEAVRECNLWDDLTKSNEILDNLAESAKVVDALKDVKYKTEEAKLIMELAEMDAINDGLFKQAYTASVDVNKLLKKYEISKILNEPYDKEGASLTVESGSGGIYNEIWAERLARMYIKWAEKQGHKWRIVEKYPSSNNGGIKSATIEFESSFVYGYLMGESGIHHMIGSLQDGSSLFEASLAAVDVIPLFLESVPDLPIEDKDLLISFPSCGEEQGRTVPAVHIEHVPTGLTFQSSGERSRFANKMKALNRLKAKLLTILGNQEISRLSSSINRSAVVDIQQNQEARKYVFYPDKLVQDVKTGVQLPDLNAVLNGNIEPLINAHIGMRQANPSV
ncbi:hypothetical protein M9H77_04000 [Catharanthus roseus]|uniref:Uncharacterized protein n=1 Tax=Catharanthus roseus TaxID=4058 RepID=A0ACC0CD26_CATRO|nr:hypothetical protein M9H77_04000 [Catharanthus roseus]